MKAAFAEDVLMDILTGRNPAFRDSSELLDAAADGRIAGYVMLPTVTDISKISSQRVGNDNAGKIVSDIALILEILPLPEKEELLMSFNDSGRLEEHLLAASAKTAGIEIIATNRKNKYAGLPVRAMTPGEILSEYIK
jgi:predicted nucleic acid-binding protein